MRNPRWARKLERNGHLGVHWLHTLFRQRFFEFSEQLLSFFELPDDLWIALQLGQGCPWVASENVAQFLYVSDESRFALFLRRGDKLEGSVDASAVRQEPISGDGVLENRS